MLVVGIDPGIATTGYGFVRDTDAGIQLIGYGVVTTSPGLSIAQRLSILYQELNQILSLHQPESGAVEKLFFQKNVSTAISVGQARGVALLALAHNQVEVSEYTPLEIKQAVTGYGGAEKMQVQRMVKTVLAMEDIPRPDDAADALAIAICHLHSARLNQFKI
ncbi:MAG: crossover junction endodeoxyribonuclease RuvC [Chloroflexota bacterium]|jgi:crossover junction endodeoxyribonuclease RuvC